MAGTVAFQTLGCRLNQAETESVATDFADAGWRIVADGETADVVVVNTCTVTNQSDRKSRNTINQAARQGAVVVVTGCYAESARDELEAQPEVTYVVDNDHKARIFDLVDAHCRGEILHPARLPAGRFDYSTAGRHTRTRTAIKIQDGCDNFCTFCIIPFVRGRAVSRPADDVLRGVRDAVDRGSREIVITGVNMGRYADDGVDFTALLARVLDLPGDFRVRISSLEPEPLDGRFLALFDNPRLCPHLHLCLQSGSERVLLAMRRTYTAAEYRTFAEELLDRHAGFNLTTDIIVGFPGETEEDFQASCRISRELGFTHVHTFRYSIRDGTLAARMPGQVPDRVKSARSAEIRRISVTNKRRFRDALVGGRETVLIERVSRGRARGYGEHYVPVVLPAAGCSPNSFVEVDLDSLGSGDDPVVRGTPFRNPLCVASPDRRVGEDRDS